MGLGEGTGHGGRARIGWEQGGNGTGAGPITGAGAGHGVQDSTGEGDAQP